MSRNSETGLLEALANPHRRAILRFLRDKDFVKAGDIAADLGLGHSTLSAHLKALKHAELVEARRHGTEIHYRANLTMIEEAIVILSQLRGTPEADPAARSRRVADEC